MSVTYTAILDVSEDSRSLGTYKQAVLVLRWLFDDTRISQLARDNDIAVSTAYDYRDEAIEVLAARRPSLHGALWAAKAAGHSHVLVDGTLIATDRIGTPGPTRGVDLWWSGKDRHHGGNIQVVSAPDGWPLWTSGVRPGREHDTTAARSDPELLTQIRAWVDDGRLGLADLGYEGEADPLRIPIKEPVGGELTVDQQAYNAAHGALRALGERANSLLKTTFKPCVAGAAAPGASATSSPPRSSFSTTNTAAPHDSPTAVTQRDPQVARKAQCPCVKHVFALNGLA